MSPIRFPDPRFSTPEGIVAFGGKLTSDNLIEAYSRGIFPWPIEGLPLTWFCPPRRAILEFKRLHIPRSLALARRKSTFRFTIDRDFSAVIKACSTIARPQEAGTWITQEMIEAYCGLNHAGRAHSVEAWDGDQLVGGIYGVDAGGVFGGESMFHLRPNASKLALLFLFEHLSSKGSTWMDIQVMSPHMQTLGAIEITRHRFLNRLAVEQERGLKLFN
ncbi:MAG: leucyl/phenylalanyl-tRNA---protein transferase [Blastocatellia bacterium]|jgi:leucyl/phenylalanyl-tRNA--protein transferase|nr:leucyl/phenylalanyl-tRNA---protein transferase [Blastocatellia bacterium]